MKRHDKPASKDFAVGQTPAGKQPESCPAGNNHCWRVPSGAGPQPLPCIVHEQSSSTTQMHLKYLHCLLMDHGLGAFSFFRNWLIIQPAHFFMTSRIKHVVL
ncbi:hypothetical protein [Laribacter hongkongensis]|uniref:hypothetical protein n=1 Tax=Laribacter hongkongensis TaxID=168471 RepID=UPI001EFC6F0F|nr:hypothetical protein [Laribacter hongkongensis]MCG9082256.1 hypothetical protein [Laribacter hongkongensis]MCG9115142.1 hypothetical protein [Laribacter hongkongensis]